jgi:hypothetical protein
VHGRDTTRGCSDQSKGSKTAKTIAAHSLARGWSVESLEVDRNGDGEPAREGEFALMSATPSQSALARGDLDTIERYLKDNPPKKPGGGGSP